MDPVAVGADAETSDPGQHRRFRPLSGAKPKRSMFETPTLPTLGHSRSLRNAGTHPVTDGFMYEMPTLQTLGHGRPPPMTGTQLATDRFMYEQPTFPTPVHSHSRPPPRTGTQPVNDRYIPVQADLADTIAQLQFEIDALKFAPPGYRLRPLVFRRLDPDRCLSSVWS